MPLKRQHVEILRMICVMMIAMPGIFFFLRGVANTSVLIFRLTLMFFGVVGYVWCEWKLRDRGL